MKESALKLGVNIDHVATLRQARGTDYPDPIEAARLVLAAGADSITVHLREDRRHIQDEDVRRLRVEPDLYLNLEMANVPEIVRIAHELRPDEVCLVPEKREERTTEGGLDVVGQRSGLASVIAGLAAEGIRVSLFIEPDVEVVDVAVELGAHAVELHTGRFADMQGEARKRETERLVVSADHAHRLGLQVNAGHGLHLENVKGLHPVAWLDTLNIGHSIVARAVMVGLPEAVREMHRAMAALRSEAMPVS